MKPRAAFVSCLAIGLATTSVAGAQSYTFTKLVDSTTLADAGFPADWQRLSASGINSDGAIAFDAWDGSRYAVFSLSDIGITNIADTATNPYINISSWSLNDAGTVVMSAVRPDSTRTSVILTGSGGALTTIADQVADNLLDLRWPMINNSGTVLFSSDGIYTSAGGEITKLVDHEGPFFIMDHGFINNAGSVAFVSDLDTGGAGAFVIDGGSFTTIVNSDDGPIIPFGLLLAMNDQGTVVFKGRHYLETPSVVGLYSGDGGSLTTLLDPHHGEIFVGHGHVAINNDGTVVFNGHKMGGQISGLYVTSAGDPNPQRVVETGDTLDGRIVQFPRMSREAINDSGQIAFSVQFDDGDNAIYRADPRFLWSTAADGDWNTGDNWLHGRAPGSADTAEFDLVGAYTVSLTEATTVGGLGVLRGEVTLDLNNQAFNSGGLVIGSAGSPAAFTIMGGEEVSSASLASATAAMPSQSALSAQHFHTHETAAGPNQAQIDNSLTVPAGSSFHLSGSSRTLFSGHVLIDGGGGVSKEAHLVADQLIVGDSETAEFNVTTSGILEANRAVLGDDQNFVLTGGTGALVIDSLGEAFFDELLVGDGGTGRVEIRSGGNLRANKIAMADNLLSKGTIRVIGYHPEDRQKRSTLTVEDWDIGGRGEAQVFVEDGADIVVGENEAVQWRIHPDASLTLFSTEEFNQSFIHVPENSTLEIQIGERRVLTGETPRMVVSEGARAITTAVIVGPTLLRSPEDPLQTDGHLIVRGLSGVGDSPGQLVVHQEVKVGRNGVVDVLDGGGIFIGPAERIIHEIIEVGTDVSDKIIVLNGGKLTFDGVINVRNDLDVRPGAAFIRDGGQLNTGSSPGTGTLNADLIVEPGGRWIVEIAGLVPDTEYDQLIVNGDVTIDGTIVFQFLDGFAPQQGQQFEFLTVGGLADLAGATFEIQNLQPGFLFDVAPRSNGFTMTALNDGQFVPEPGTIVLLLMVLAAAGNGRRRKRHRQTEAAR